MVSAAPIPWAKRFGGPGTRRGAPRRGATLFWASQPTGLSFGPVSTRAQKPYASGTSSHSQPVARITTAVVSTTPATTRAAFSFTGFGNPRIPLM